MPLGERLKVLTKAAWEQGVKDAHQAVYDDDRITDIDGEDMVMYLDLPKIMSGYTPDIIAFCDPSHNPKSSGSKKSGSNKSSNDPELANLPYDSNLCAKRMWNGGFGCQCQKPSAEEGLCPRHHKMMTDYGGVLPHGLYNEERPLLDPTKPSKKHPWADLKSDDSASNGSKMKVQDIRDKLDEMGLDTSGKKAVILERLNDAHDAENQDMEVAPDEQSPKKEKKKEKKEKKKEKKEKKKGKKDKMVLTPKKIVDPEPQLNKEEEEEMDAPEEPQVEKEEQEQEEEQEEEAPEEAAEEAPEEAAEEAPEEAAEEAPEEAAEEAPEEAAEEAPEEAAEEAPEEAAEEAPEEAAEDDDTNDSSSEDELDSDDLNEVEFEGVDYLVNEEDDVFSMAARKIGKWDDGSMIWDETEEGEKAKEFHNLQQQ
jgi:hypothetical protein